MIKFFDFFQKKNKKYGTLHEFACHPCAIRKAIVSVWLFRNWESVPKLGRQANHRRQRNLTTSVIGHILERILETRLRRR